MPQANLSPIDNFLWQNWHATAGVGGNVQRFFTPRNSWLPGPGPSGSSQKFHAAIAGLGEIVRQAEAARKRVRAIGSGWSLNAVGFTDEYLVNTARLSEWFLGFSTDAMLTPAYRPKKRSLAFAQCGVQIKTLSAYLEAERLALSTSGASNGQTIVGALSTGTHGSANAVGAMQDTVLGLHIVAEGGKHYFIQRQTKPVVTARFAKWLGATLIENDEIYLAALVSFGSFGLIQGVLLQTEPVYALDRYVEQRDFTPELRAAIATLDVSRLGLRGGAVLPFHFEVVLHPLRLGKGEGGAFLRYMYKRKLEPGEPLPKPPVTLTGGQERSEDLISLAGTISDHVPELIPDLLMRELCDAFAPPQSGQPLIGTHGQIFADTVRAQGGTSMEIGVPLTAVHQAIEVIVGAQTEAPFGTPLALRFVRSSQATLAFTRFGRVTCTMEMPGLDSQRTRAGFERIQRRLAERNVPHTYHWGQALPLEPEWVRKAFGARRTRWLAARRSFLGPGGRAMFTNALLSRCGLAEP